MAQVVEERAAYLVVVTQQAGVGLGEHGGEPVERLLGMGPAHMDDRCEQRACGSLGVAGNLGRHPIGRQRGVAGNERRDAADGGHRGDPARHDHTTRQCGRTATGEPHHGAGLQAQMPDEGPQIASTRPDGPRRVVGRSAVAGSVGGDHGDAAVAAGAVEAGELSRRPGGAVQHHHGVPAGSPFTAYASRRPSGRSITAMTPALRGAVEERRQGAPGAGHIDRGEPAAGLSPPGAGCCGRCGRTARRTRPSAGWSTRRRTRCPRPW